MLVLYTEEQRKAWRRAARGQGLVCLLCGEPPALHRRHEFYDSGLCRACAAELDGTGLAGVISHSAQPSMA